MKWVEDETAQRGYADQGEIIRRLIEREVKRKVKIADMQALVDEGRASGISTRSLEEIWQDARQRARASDKAA